MRSNWQLYMEEFAVALAVAGKEGVVEEFIPDQTITPFERKYKASGQALFKLTATL